MVKFIIWSKTTQDCVFTNVWIPTVLAAHAPSANACGAPLIQSREVA